MVTISSTGAEQTALGDDAVREMVLRVSIIYGQQRPGVPGGEYSAATRRCTLGDRLSSRSVLEMCGRDRPIRRASSSWVAPKSSSSC